MFVVFVQSLDPVTNRVCDVIGPFRSHNDARDFIRTMREEGREYANDNLYWIGIRTLLSQSKARQFGA
jgi:hypothetical protein